MASNPGLLTEWPWQRLGNFKYIVVAPWVAYGFYELAMKGWREVDIGYLLIFPAMLFRMLHNQIWISLSRFQNARSKHRIVDKSLDFEQVDRERNWDDQIIFNAILFYLGHTYLKAARYLPWWSSDGAIITALLHIGPVEFLYYWFHRALHHHFLYSRYHSHHHASIVTEPITSVIHPFAEHIVYFALFAIPLLGSLFTGTASILTYFFYISYIDFMNNMGHCNFELVPTWLFHAFPPLKYLMYTPSFHSLHHTQFRTNYSLFMPFYDYVYNTMDKSSDDLYERSLKGKEESIDVVHLTHPTTLQSIFHFRLGFAAFASNPFHSKWYMIVMSPVYWISMMVTWLYGSTFTVERNTMDDQKMQTWAIPRYTFQYNLGWEKEAINDLIEKAILDADKRGIKVVSLGLLNQAKELNGSGELYLQKHPNLKVKIVDGSSLAAALVIKSIPKEVDQVLITGSLSKVASAIATSLCQRGIQVIMNQKHEYHMLKPQLSEEIASNLLFSRTSTPEVWLVGDGFEDKEQRRAQKGTKFIPYSQFPLRKMRKNCTYYTTPAMKIPKTLENMHSCENWLPRRVMSAWRVAGIVHALEGWDMHECGNTVLDMEKILSAAIRHGFVPLQQA
ncbi:Fatty acid hydroxylase superfamily [Rhynchospora pubera]|uniref:aldehyde oxygenase (deformylating) n=1 Tax=Rhynchospora pubera TaxID=906938 RepID=A0AAV8EYL1_9POAL|nr:Fatty acid hydroxylase superfamily [Rhynchospora pubera]